MDTRIFSFSLLLLSLIIALSSSLWAAGPVQNSTGTTPFGITKGIGLGLDFGGIGVKIDGPEMSGFIPTVAIGLTAPNIGLKYMPPMEKNSEIRPYGVFRFGITRSALLTTETYYYGSENSQTLYKMYPGTAFGIGARWKNFEAEMGYVPKSRQLANDLDRYNAPSMYNMPVYLSFGMNF